MLTIKIATLDDAAVIADLSRQTFFETFAASNTKEDMDLFMSTDFNKQKLMNELALPGNIFLLASENETPVGYVRMVESASKKEFNGCSAIEIARIYTTKERLGSGVGKLLMQESLKIAADWNKEIVWLGVWEKNERAISFYKKWGFEKFGEHDFLLGNDRQSDWLMMKKLSHHI